MRHFLRGEGGRGERVRGGRCPGVCGGLVGGQVLVRVRALSSVLSHSGALEPHGGGRHGLSVSRGLLLGLEQPLVAPLTHRGFVRTLLRRDGVSVWTHLSPVLWPDAWVHLPCVGGYVRLVLGVRSRDGGLRGPLLMGHGVGR